MVLKARDGGGIYFMLNDRYMEENTGECQYNCAVSGFSNDNTIQLVSCHLN